MSVVKRQTCSHFHEHQGRRQVVTSFHIEAEPCESPVQVLSVRVCALTLRHIRLTAEVFVVEYKGHPPSGVGHIVAIVFTQRDGKAATSVK